MVVRIHQGQLQYHPARAHPSLRARPRAEASPGPLSDQYLRELASRAINPSDHLCPPSTPFVDFLFASLDPVDPDILGELLDLAADALSTVYSLLIDTEDTPQYFGYNGEYNHIMLKTERDMKRFWDIPSADFHILSSEAFHDLFVAEYPRMVAPDAT